MDKFEIGDVVVYNPNIPNLAPNTKRYRDIGVITDIDDNYLHITFEESGNTHRILPWAISHFSQTNKGRRSTHRRRFRNTLQNIPRAREGMEARKVWNERVNLPFEEGPGRNFASAWPRTVDPNRRASRRLTHKRNTNNGLRNINTSLFSGGSKRAKRNRPRATRRSNP